MKLLRKEDYAVGWICALPFPEWKASRLLLDEVHEDLSLGPAVKNQYVYGSMNGHNIVMGCLPSSQMGKGAAASVASEMGVIFPFLRFGLLVGIGGGVPSSTNDIRLGDVVISQPNPVEHHGGVIQYDYGKTIQDCSSLQDTGLLNQPPYILLSALSKIKSAPHSSSKFGEYLDSVRNNIDDQDFRDPPRHDRLFEASYVHPPSASSCDSCSAEHEIKRTLRRDAKPVSHYGTIASGDQVMKSAQMRDSLSKKHNGILCFEMEAAGLMNQFPCLVIKGICDYCDSHKNKAWQPFAAAVAAAWAKELLRNVAAGERIIDGVSSAPLTVQRNLAQVKMGENEHSTIVDSKDYKRRREQVRVYLGASTDPQDTLERVDKQRAPETGEWIRYELKFANWLSRAFPVLWVSGTPGAGKTFLSASMASYLRRHLSRGPSATGTESSVGYYFFKDNDSGTRGFSQALRDIAFQICQSDIAYEMYVEGLSNSQVDINTLAGAWKRLFRDFWIRDLGDGAVTQNAAYIVLDGIDEAFKTDVTEFLGYLQDLNFDAASQSRLQIILVGRTHLTDEISDALPMGQFHDISVDLDKTAADIQTYVKGSMRKSRLLRKVSKKLQNEVLDVLSAQSNGMFLWVDLMLRELNTKRSEREVSEALHKAPKGIFAILAHVLDGLSESLQKEDAEDFNNLLQWVASAPAPLTLGILDAMLKYKSPTGDSVLLLESHLRRQYASFFNLLRIDGRTTAELQKLSKDNFDFGIDGDDSDDGLNYDKEEVLSSGPEDDVGMDDFDADFDSDLGSTYVVFTHASIGDFFRDEAGATIRASNGPRVGIEIESARAQTLKTILEVLMDNELYDSQNELQDDEAAEKADNTLALQEYARAEFLSHVVTTDPTKISAEERKELALLIVKLFRTKEGFANWIEASDTPPSFWSRQTMPMIRRWVDDAEAQDGFSDNDRGWVECTAENPFSMLQPIALFHAERWLQDNLSEPVTDFRFILKYRQMLDAPPDSKEMYSDSRILKAKSIEENNEKQGMSSAKQNLSIGDQENRGATGDDTDGSTLSGEDEEDVTIQDILDQAEWAGFEKTALWNKRVAMVMRDTGFPDESKAYFETAIDLDPDMLEAHGDLANAFLLQGEHSKSLEILEGSISQLRAKLAGKSAADIVQTKRWLSLDLTTSGRCYEALESFEEACNAFKEAWRINPEDSTSAFEFVRLTNSRNKTQECVDFMREMDHRRSEEGDCSYVTNYIALQAPDTSASFVQAMFRVCVAIGEVPFTHAMLRHAVAYSIKYNSLGHTLLLRLLLGCAYILLPETEDRGVQILEKYAEMKSSSDLHPTVTAIHETGIAALAFIHFDRAWNTYGTPECRKHLEKLEKLAAVDIPEKSFDVGSTSNVLLGSWLRTHGQPGDATAHFRPHVMRVLRELDSDTPAHATSELLALADILVLAGDEANPAAIVRTLLHAEGLTREQVESVFRSCDGMCTAHSDIWHEKAMFLCQNCYMTQFCEPCLEKLRAGTASQAVMAQCSQQHEWLRIDVREETVPEGKILIGASDEVMDFVEWKQGLKRAWSIK